MQGLALRMDEAAELPLLHAHSAFCITVYNETLDYLKRTLASILVSFDRRPRETLGGASVCLCVMIDGASVADPGLMRWFRDQGMIDDDGDALARPYGLYLSAIAADALFDLVGEPEQECLRPQGELIRLIVCVKPENRGKLHSHAVFFREICPWLRPDFCFQIDSGTVIHETAYPSLITRMEEECNVGALAPCVMTPPPCDRSVFLSTWQFMDFVLQKSFYWPLEDAAGHLSVVPGQFCVFRWSALHTPKNGDGPLDGCNEHDPVDAYLRGLLTEKPLEKVMFLAEDRVIGNEIVSRGSRCWRLTYSPEAQAVTDACQTLGELMRQRRRWNNSALACRLALLIQTPAFLARPDRRPSEKIRFVLAMFCQFVLMLVELGACALSAAAMLAFANLADLAAPADMALAVVAGAAAAGILATAVRGRWRDGLGAERILSVIRNTLSVALTASVIGLAVRNLPGPALFLIATPVLLSIGTVALTNAKWLPKILVLNSIYALASTALTPLLSTYSVLNMHDVSWGTKGLTSARLGKTRMVGMRRLRGAVVVAWASLNISLMALAVSVPGVTSSKLNIVFEATCVVGGLGLSIALAHLVLDRVRRRRGFRPVPAGVMIEVPLPR